MTASERRVVAIPAAARAAVEAQLRRRDLAPRVRERLEMMKAAALGQELNQIAQWSGRSVGTVRRWLTAWTRGGIAALADAPRPGRPPHADATYLAALEAAVETPPPVLGLPFDVWTSPRLSAYLAETTGVRIAPGWLRALLARRRFACGRPKHSLRHLRDPEEVALCEAELAEVGGKGGRRPGAVRVASRR
jgi:transposase